MRKEGAVGSTFWCVAILACVASAAMGQAVNPDDIQGVLRTLQGPNTVDNPRQSTTDDGYMKYLGAPTGNTFSPGTAASKPIRCYSRPATKFPPLWGTYGRMGHPRLRLRYLNGQQGRGLTLCSGYPPERQISRPPITP